MYTMGVDIGSASSKVVVLKDGKEILFAKTVQAGTGTSGPKTVLQETEKALNEYGLTLEDIDKKVATGYGRYAFEGVDKQISEISCHAKGIHFLMPEARTIIDIGGQDAKSIALNENGQVSQFFMNDKCAAGTGRFLDQMAKVLEVDLDKMQDYDKQADSPVSISSTCAVFAESEVISQLSQGATRENIIAGVHNSTAAKVSGLVYRTGLKDPIVMCGGVAQNSGVVRAIRDNLQKDVVVAPQPQITGALGASLYAYELGTNN